jgi:hypothetical protein
MRPGVRGCHGESKPNDEDPVHPEFKKNVGTSLKDEHSASPEEKIGDESPKSCSEHPAWQSH